MELFPEFPCSGFRHAAFSSNPAIFISNFPKNVRKDAVTSTLPGGFIKGKAILLSLFWAAAASLQAQQTGSRDATMTGIPGVVASGAKWTKIWQQGGNSADGIVAAKDGSVLVAQEDYDAVLKIDENGKTSVFVANAKGVGSLSMDRQGRLYGVHRTERPGSTKPDRTSIVNAITVLAPERKVVTDKWENRTPLDVRPNDLAADSYGGAYFTSGFVYYASPKGTVSIVAENIRTNWIVFKP